MFSETRRNTMAWRKPKITEVPLGAEINMYVCAELKR
jgi:coenzyme PQQ precursor peptide PqqA